MEAGDRGEWEGSAAALPPRQLSAQSWLCPHKGSVGVPAGAVACAFRSVLPDQRHVGVPLCRASEPAPCSPTPVRPHRH